MFENVSNKWSEGHHGVPAALLEKPKPMFVGRAINRHTCTRVFYDKVGFLAGLCGFSAATWRRGGARRNKKGTFISMRNPWRDLTSNLMEEIRAEIVCFPAPTGRALSPAGRSGGGGGIAALPREWLSSLAPMRSQCAGDSQLDGEISGVLFLLVPKVVEFCCALFFHAIR